MAAPSDAPSDSGGAPLRRALGVPAKHSKGMLAVLRASPVPTAVTRLADGVILFANPACLELLGWEEGEFVGQKMIDAGVWARPERRAALLAELGREGRVRDLEEEVSTRSGQTKVVLASISRFELDGEPCLIEHIHDITERRRLEERLRDSEERFRQVTETLLQGFLLRSIDPPAVLYASPAVARIFGVDLATVYRDPWAIQALIHEDDREAVLARRDAMTGATDFEFRIVRPDGETRWIRTRAEPVRMTDGRAARIAVVSEDVTDEHVLSEALRDSEERIRLMVDGVQDYAIFMLDVNGTVATWNAGAQRIKGYTADEIIGRHFAAFYTSEDIAAGVPERELVVAREAGRVEDEGWRVRRDGSRFWANVVITAMRDADATLRGYAKITRDLTERRCAELELRGSEERFRLLAQNSSDVISRLSLDMRIQYVSPACRPVYGYEPEEMVGRFAFEFVHPDDVDGLRGDFSPDGDHAATITNVHRVLRRDGETVWVEAKIRALRDVVSGEPTEFHAVARDVSERKQAEADVSRAKDDAELANAAKSEFLSRMSHELRTPLHAILGFGELLAREDLSPQQREYLSPITRAGAHLLELINEVLDLSRIEGGALHLSLEPVDVGEVVGETLEMLEPLAAARSVTVAPPRYAEDEVCVRADRQRLKQVLLNLLSNAVKYNRPGGEVRVVAARHGSSRVRIEVTDTGVGIAADDLARAFAAFERLGAETTEVEGTGLGLALAKRLIEAMGGAIGVESEVGHGTTFWLDLPKHAAPALRSASREPEQQPAEPAGPVRSDARTVLYIEDNPSNVKLVALILRKRPEVKLLVAQQGSLGLELAREHVPALVLLDMDLPDMPGEEVLRRLRGDARTADVTVVMVSADAIPEHVAHLRACGADGYLTKPFELEQFLAVVDAPATTRRSGDPTHSDAQTAPPSPHDEPPDHELVDSSPLDKLRDLYPGVDVVTELIEMFLEDSPARLRALATAAAANDAEAVRYAAHAWRGACSATGAQRLVALLADVELRARAGAIPDASQLTAVERSYDATSATLRRRIPGNR
jgi:PAS domain S-box-containing protein